MPSDQGYCFEQGGMAAAFIEIEDEFPSFSPYSTSPPQIAPWNTIPKY